MAQFLRELNSQIIDTHKSINDLNTSLSISLEGSKKWTIASRFLSGTGLWSVQNRLRAVVSVMAEYQRANLKQMETNQKNMDLLDGLATRTTALKDAQQKLNALDTNKSYRGRLNKQIYLEEQLLKRKKEVLKFEEKASLTDYQKEQLIHAKRKVDDYTEELASLVAVEEQQKTIADNYKVRNEEALEIMNHRLGLMKKMDEEQNKQITGGVIGQRLMGMKELAKARRFERMQREGIEEGSVKAKMLDMKDRAKMLKEAFSKDTGIRDQNILVVTTRLIKSRVIEKVRTFAVAAIKSMIMASIYAVIIIGLIGMAAALVKKYWADLQPVINGAMELFDGFLGVTMTLFATAWDYFKDAWSSIENGDVFGVLTNLALGVGSILLGLLVISAGLALSGLMVFFGGLFALLKASAKDAWDKGLLSVIGFIIKLIGLVVLVAGIFIGWPVVLLGLLIMLIPKFAKWVKKTIFGRATGGVVSEDVTLVGEQGPELVSLPSGSRVHTNTQSKRMMGNSVTNNISVNVQGRLGASDQEIRDIARKVGEQINRELNRTTSTKVRM